MYLPDWELNECEIGADLSCPECGTGYSVDDYPENCARASVGFTCEECGYGLTLTMHHYPTFQVHYRYSKGNDPKELPRQEKIDNSTHNQEVNKRLARGG